MRLPQERLLFRTARRLWPFPSITMIIYHYFDKVGLAASARIAYIERGTRTPIITALPAQNTFRRHERQQSSVYTR